LQFLLDPLVFFVYVYSTLSIPFFFFKSLQLFAVRQRSLSRRSLPVCPLSPQSPVPCFLTPPGRIVLPLPPPAFSISLSFFLILILSLTRRPSLSSPDLASSGRSSSFPPRRLGEGYAPLLCPAFAWFPVPPSYSLFVTNFPSTDRFFFDPLRHFFCSCIVPIPLLLSQGSSSSSRGLYLGFHVCVHVDLRENSVHWQSILQLSGFCPPQPFSFFFIFF